jgi:hypothetical protein
MTRVQVPQAISVDTSLLAVWAREWTRGESKALGMLKALLRSNARLLLTLHHVVELLGHGSDEVVAGRVAFVRSLQQAYWVKSHDDDSIGGVLDLTAAEVRAKSADPAASYEIILARTRPEMLRFGEIGHVVSLLQAPEIVSYARSRVQRSRVVQSLLHTEVAQPWATRELVAPQQRLVPLATMLSNFDRLEKHVAFQLVDVGDRKLSGHTEAAKHFFDELRRHARVAARDGRVTLADVLMQLGIEEADLSGMTSAEMLADKHLWQTQSGIIGRSAGVAAGTVEKLRPHDVPSLYLRGLIADCQSKARRASGGNPGDASLACLSLYVGLTTVDKRTAECVRQIRRGSAALDAVMGRVMPLASLGTLEAEIRGLCS